MSTYLIIIIVPLISIIVYRRYFPVLGIPCEKTSRVKTKMILDIRDYNADDNHQSDLRIPYAYLRRFIQEIPNKKLHVIASDRLELNLGLRYLKAKGYRVASYEISNFSCNRE